jgi:F-type H+-transporting ATPase subunit epsilon
MDSIFNLIILTPEKKIYEDDVMSASIDTNDGRILILPHHMKIVSSLKISNITITDKELKKHILCVGRGILRFENNTLTLLTDFCEFNNSQKNPHSERNKYISNQFSNTDMQFDEISKKIEEDLANIKI